MTDQAMFQKLVDSMIKDGSYISNKIEFKVLNSSYRYLAATEDIKNGELLGRVPLEKVITPYNKVVSDFCKELPLKSLMGEELSRTALSCFILLDKANPNSVFKDYYNTWPEFDYPEYLQFKPKETVEKLKGTNLYRAYLQRMEDLNNSYNIVKPFLDKNNISFDSYAKAFVFSYTRCVQVMLDNNDCVNCIVFYFDLLSDGGKDRNTSYLYNKEKHTYDYAAVKDIKKGDEILIDYGDFPIFDYCNTTLLCDYGYVLSDNLRKLRIDFDFEDKKYQFDGYDLTKKGCDTLIGKIENELKMNKDTIIKKLKDILNSKIEIYDNILKDDIFKNEKNIIKVIEEEKGICTSYLSNLN